MTSPFSTKPVISELKAAAESHRYILQTVHERWPVIYKQFREIFGDKFQVADEDIAEYDLVLAATAFDLQAVRNLFPADQAKRIEGWVENLIDSKEWGQYAVGEVRAYSEQFQHDVENIKNGCDPLSAIPVRLLRRWLGNRLNDFELKIGDRKTGYMRPFMIDLAVDVVMSLPGTWKVIKDRYELVEEDIPMEIDYESLGLYEVGGYPDESRPDGTIIYRDENGQLKETWLRPEKAVQFLAALRVKKIEKICRVLVKGHWDGIKEARMRLSDQAIAKFADKNGIVFALCHFTKGEAEYHLMNKKAWENLESIDEIVMDTNLSETERMVAIRKLSH